MEYRKYANRLYIFFIVIMMLAGCSSNEDNYDDISPEITDEQENIENDSGVGNGSSNEDEWAQQEDIIYGGVITEDTSPSEKGNKEKDENAEALEDKAEEILEDNPWGDFIGQIYR